MPEPEEEKITYYNLVINFVHSVNSKLNIIRNTEKINLNPRKYE